MRVAIDTNVLIYAEGLNGRDREAAAIAVLEGYPAADLVMSVQVLSELFSVLTKKARLSPEQASLRVADWSEGYEVVDTTHDILLAAITLVGSHRIGFWDAIILASAAAAECTLLLTENMQDGFTWRGVTVRNPFAAP